MVEPPLTELLSLTGRTAVVTGGGRGIGRAVAHRLAEAGAKLVVADLSQDSAEAVAKELANAGAAAVAVRCDVTSADDAATLAARAADEYGSIDILVNNAGIFPAAPVADFPPDAWAHVLTTNLVGVFHCSQAVAPLMVTAGRGVIVNIASTAAFSANGAPGLSAYVASKFGVRGLTQSLAVELGPAGVRVVGVAPSLTDTPGIGEQRDALLAAGLGDILETHAQSLPLRRAAAPDDIARVVLFCASDLAGYVTGTTILVDGGDRTR